jgi:heme/copper-type cytochrome/quinol oxidase subunit 1
MEEKAFLYFLSKIITIFTTVLLFGTGKINITMSVISTLSFACIFFIGDITESTMSQP